MIVRGACVLCEERERYVCVRVRSIHSLYGFSLFCLFTLSLSLYVCMHKDTETTRFRNTG